MLRLALAGSAALAGLASTSGAATLFFDFGDSSQVTPGNYNNVVVNPPGVLSIPNAIDSAGNGTGVSVAVSGFFNGSNTQGTTAPAGAAAIFHPQATRDNGFGHAGVFGANPLTPMGTVALSGLDPNTAYDFTFFGSRIGATDNRETEYAVSGANSGSALLNTSGNTSLVADVLGISPDALGNVTIQIDPGPNNNNSSQFWYIAAMRVTAVPEPTGALISAVVAAGLTRRRRA